MRPSLVLGALALAAAACERSTQTQPPAAAAGAPAAHYAVGPIPGGGERSERTNPFADDRGAATSGRRLFVAYNCAGCHGGHAGGGMGPSLRDDVWLYGGADGDVFASIAEGRANGMPAWGTLLPESQIWLLTTYVKSLRTPHEAQPPR